VYETKVIFVTPDNVREAPGGIGGILASLSDRLGREGYEFAAVVPNRRASRAPSVAQTVRVEEIDAKSLRRQIANYDPGDTVVHFNYPLLHPELILAATASIPTIATIHTTAIGELKSLATVSPASLTPSDAAFVGTFPFQYLAEARGSKASAVIGVSRSVMNETTTSHAHARNWRWQVLQNGVDLNLFRPGGREGPSERPTLLFVGRHIARKGIADLVRAFGRIRLHPSRPILVLAGRPSAATYRLIQQYLAAAGRRDVRIVGFVSRHDLVRLLSDATALVFPSHYEGCPLAVLEALGTGCPVVGYAIPSLVEIVGEEQSGCVLVPPFDVEGLSRAIAQLLDSSEYQAVLRNRAINLAKASFDLERVATSYRRLYETAVEGG